MVTAGRRIVVYGPSGTGKTVVARRIARRLGLPHIELDAIFWTPNWVGRPPEEFRAHVSAALAGHPGGWVLDGDYSRVPDLVLPLADTVVWLRLPLRVAVRWLWKRTITRAWRRELLWGTNRESFRIHLLSRSSRLLYQVTHWHRSLEKIRQDLEQIPHQASVIVLRSVREVESFLHSLDHAATFPRDSEACPEGVEEHDEESPPTTVGGGTISCARGA